MKLGVTRDANFRLRGEGHAFDPPDSPAATLLGAFSLWNNMLHKVIRSSHLIPTWIKLVYLFPTKPLFFFLFVY